MDKNEQIVLTDENGVEEAYQMVDMVTYEGSDYVVLLPVDEKEAEEGFVILRVEDNGTSDTDDYCDVEDDAVLDAVFEAFKKQNEDRE